MSHHEQLQFVLACRTLYPAFFAETRVLEVGSLDINGSVRQFFDDCYYIGVDLNEGNSVDLVVSGKDIPLDMGPVDVVISCEMFEHNKDWAETWEHMVRLCRPGGLIIFTCATIGRPEHGTTRTTPADSPFINDYYRNLSEIDFRKAHDFDSSFEVAHFSVNASHKDLQFVGIKKG